MSLLFESYEKDFSTIFTALNKKINTYHLVPEGISFKFFFNRMLL